MSGTGNQVLAIAAAALLALPLVGFIAAQLHAVEPASVVAARAEAQYCGSPDVQFIGFSDALNKQNFEEFAVAELSGIAYDAMRDHYVAVADRAGAVLAHVFTLNLPVTEDSMGVPEITSVSVLEQPDGTPYNGFNFDGEGIALSGGGQLRWVSSEGGSGAGEQPEVRAFTPDGRHILALQVPPAFQIGTNNLSFESLSISPNARGLFTVNEGPLPADGRTPALESRVRILKYEDRGPDGYQPTAQYFYLTEAGRSASDLGVVEVIALTETSLLVMERGFVAGSGNTVRVFRTSLDGAMDVSAEPSLAAPGLEPVTKEMVFDLADCPPSGAATPPGAVQPNPLLDNFEAMALGAELAGGRRALILVSDDNGSTGQTTRVVVLAVSTPALVGQDWLR